MDHAEFEAKHRDLTSRLGFGDGITEPQADNDTIVQAWAEERWGREAAEAKAETHRQAVRDHADALGRINAENWRILCEVTGYEPDGDTSEDDPRAVYEEMVEQIRRPLASAYAIAAADREALIAEVGRVIDHQLATTASGDFRLGVIAAAKEMGKFIDDLLDGIDS